MTNSRRPGGNLRRGPTKVLSYTFLIAATLYFLTPLYWLVVATTKDNADLVGSFGFWFAHVNLWRNITDATTADGGLFWRWVANSLLYSGFGSAVATLLAAMCGYALAKFSFPGRGLVFGVVLGGIFMPATLIAVPLFLMLNALNLTNTYLAVLLPSFVTPFGVYVLRVYTHASVSDELLEAARVDGASEARIFFSIVLRVLVPGMVTVYMIQFVAVWNNFLLPLLVLNDSGKWPATLGLYSWQALSLTRPDYVRLVVTGSLLSCLPLIVLFFSLQRYLRAGLTEGALKG